MENVFTDGTGGSQILSYNIQYGAVLQEWTGIVREWTGGVREWTERGRDGGKGRPGDSSFDQQQQSREKPPPSLYT